MNRPERRTHNRTHFNPSSSCMLKHLISGKVLRAEVADLSIKGMRLKFSAENEINLVTDNPGNLQVLESSIEQPKVDLTGRTIIVIWQEGLELGCSFVD